MGEIARQAVEVAGRWVNSGAVAPATAAVCTMVGLSVQAPPEIIAFAGTTAGALAGSAAETLVNANHRLWQRRVDCVDQFTQSVADEAGAPVEELLREIVEDPRALELFAQAAETASTALDGWKIDLLARTFVRGTRDGGDVDAIALVFDAVRDLRRPHVRLLQLLSEANPDGVEGRWDAALVAAADKDSGAAFDALIGKLAAAGLATDTGTKTLVWYQGGAWTVTELGRRSVEYLAKRGTELDSQP